MGFGEYCRQCIPSPPLCLDVVIPILETYSGKTETIYESGADPGFTWHSRLMGDPQFGAGDYPSTLGKRLSCCALCCHDKHHDPGNLEREELILAYNFQSIRDESSKGQESGGTNPSRDYGAEYSLA